MSRDEMRAADVDRQAVADSLQSALNEGRLDLREYDERLQRAYTAKTYGELDILLADIPPTVPAQRSRLVPTTGDAEVATADARYRDATRRWLLENWSGYVGLMALCVGIWFATVLGNGEFVYFWPIWVIGPWGAVLVWNTIAGLMSGEPQRWADKQERKNAAKVAKREQKALEERASEDDDGAATNGRAT